METLTLSHLLPTLLKKSVLELERVFFKNNSSWGDLSFQLPSLDLDLASIRTSFEIIALEIMAPLFVWILLKAIQGLDSLRSLLPQPLDRF